MNLILLREAVEAAIEARLKPTETAMATRDTAWKALADAAVVTTNTTPSAPSAPATPPAPSGWGKGPQAPAPADPPKFVPSDPPAATPQ